MENYLFGKFITKEGLRHIKEHKYKSGGYSILDNLMNPFWEFVVKLMPKTLAPNSITLLGVIINLSMYFCMWYHDGTLGESVPNWAYLGFAIGLFAYQTLDAIDGKQARRTGSSSPLGQLFDHGCDTFSCALVALALIHTLKFGITWKCKLMMISLCFPFYLAQLLEYHVGVVRTHVGNLGVTEGQIAHCVIMILAFIFGPDFYTNKVADIHPLIGSVVPDYIEIKDAILAYLTLNSIFFAGNLIYEMLANQKSMSDRLYSLWGANPMVLISLSIWFLDESDPFTHKNAALMLMVISFLFTLVTTKVIISSMAKMHISSIQVEAFLFLIYLGVHYFYEGPKETEMYVLYAISTLSLILYLIFVRTSITQITSHLGIYCFSIKKPKDN